MFHYLVHPVEFFLLFFLDKVVHSFSANIYIKWKVACSLIMSSIHTLPQQFALQEYFLHNKSERDLYHGLQFHLCFASPLHFVTDRLPPLLVRQPPELKKSMFCKIKKKQHTEIKRLFLIHPEMESSVPVSQGGV